MTNTPISLIKKRYATTAAAAAASGSVQGAIVFDKEHKVICANGDVYGGNIADVEFNADHQLVITKLEGDAITLDFSDVASAQGMMTVFGQIRKAMGVNSELSVQTGYYSTRYLQGVQTLIGADIRLDNVVNQVQNLAEQVQGEVETLQQAVIDNEIVTVQAIESIQQATGLNSSLQYVLPASAWATQGADSIAQAVAQLDTRVQGIVSDGKTYTMVEQATAETGYLKTYQLNEIVGGVPTQVGAKINIPKDFLVKSASVQTVTTANVPYQGAEVGDKYMDFVINVKEGSATNEHLYIPVDDLISAISVQQNAPHIQLNIDSHNQISAEVVPGSIGSNELATQAVQTANIANGAVQTSKIGSQAVTSEKIAAQGVQGWNIANETITSDKLAQSVVTLQATTPEVIVNNDAPGYNGETIVTVGGKEVKTKVGLYWSEWSDADPT